MHHRAITALATVLGPRVSLGKSRLETLCLLVVGMVSARTVNLGHIACERPGGVQIASTYRRLQRFFQHVDLGADWTLPLVSEVLGLSGSWTLALDRTHWKIGRRDVNFLVLAVITRRFRVPLLWSLLPGSGNSGTEARIALMTRYLARFPAGTIRLLLADREFVGAKWLKFLDDNGIPFAIRLREDLRVVTEDGAQLTLFARLHTTRKTRFFSARLWNDGRAVGPLLNFAARRLKDEWLIVVSNRAPPHRAGRLPQALGHRVPLRRRQDPRPQHRGHPPHLAAQARPAHGPRHPGPRLGRLHPQATSSAPASRNERPTATWRNPGSASASTASEAVSEPNRKT